MKQSEYSAKLGRPIYHAWYTVLVVVIRSVDPRRAKPGSEQGQSKPLTPFRHGKVPKYPPPPPPSTLGLRTLAGW